MSSLVYASDPDPLSRKLLGELLEEETDYKVEMFADVAELSAALAEGGAEAVIVDGQSARGKGGAELCDRLASLRSEPVLFLALGPRELDDSGDLAARLGPLRLVQKPFTAMDLIPKLRTALERRDLARELGAARAELQRRDQALSASRREVERTTAELATTHTELATATERLVEAEQLAAVGRVVSGIAHEIGNQLALVGYAQAIKSRVADDPELTEFADIIVNAQRRLAATVEQIRDFASGTTDVRMEPADLVAAVDEALAILRYDRDVRAREIERDYQTKPLVSLCREKFSQVVINLISNAVQATGAGDTIKVEVAEDNAGMATVTVTDSGVGMSPEVLERLGEPFFTTRGGQGSGLGVGICMRIVEEHGGTLTFCSEPGSGTIARVSLPIIAEEAR